MNRRGRVCKGRDREEINGQKGEREAIVGAMSKPLSQTNARGQSVPCASASYLRNMRCHFSSPSKSHTSSSCGQPSPGTIEGRELREVLIALLSLTWTAQNLHNFPKMIESYIPSILHLITFCFVQKIN